MTTRAAVLIGVAHAADLPELQAVHPGIEAMERWALGQGMPRDAVVVLSDASAPVDVAAVHSAIAAQVRRETLTQLVVYFAGHGINDGQSEQWLLSGAPTNPNEAVNVAASAFLAARCGVPHVVLISDACRTAPVGIRALGVRGAAVFPNLPLANRQADAVDEFYACLLGDPSFEVAEATTSARVYRAVYTEALVAALTGQDDDVRTPDPDQGDGVDVVRPWPLKRALPRLVGGFLRDTGFHLRVSQTPDARVTSDPDTAWLSRLERPAGARRPRRGRGPGGPGAAAPSLADVARDAILASTGGRRAAGGATPDVPGAPELRAAGELLADLPEPARGTLTEGFLVRGAEVTGAASASGAVRPDDAATVPITGAGTGEPVLIALGSVGCTVLPFLTGYCGVLTVDDGRLVDVAYLPVGGDRADRRQQRLPEVRALHEALAAAARLGLLASLRRSDVEPLTQRITADLELDPSLAVLGAYALVDLGRRDLLAGLGAALREAVGTGVVDVDVLTDPAATPAAEPDLSRARFPLLSRTWGLQPALPDVLPDPSGVTRVPSLWSLYRADDAGTIRDRLRHDGPAARDEGGTP